MYVSADQLPPYSRIWIYQASRELTPDETIKINSLARNFIDTWTAHNVQLKGSFEILYNIFLVIMIDEKHSNASGCSIDKSIHFLQNIEKEFAVSVLDRQVFAFRENGKIKLAPRREFESLLQEGYITENTIVFNNLIQSKQELNDRWEVPMSESWHSTIHRKA